MTTHNTIKVAMARAFFAAAYADQWDEAGITGLNPSGRDWMDMTPEDTDPAALHAADTLTHDLARAHPKCRKDGAFSLDLLYAAACAVQRRGDTLDGDRDLLPDTFGHYLAMQAMGTGVGLRDAFGRAVGDAIRVPRVEFGGYSLSRDYF
ncbi:hypothetical protein [Burkholderia cepacia]|uniref:hypothetical protein n=1 Tax=Burkholderia cepacia TaxID=292 RepID=UPI00075C9F65|nr:hypothetical protein [Burkholderia cepacia]KWH50714.1 hypothetical protein WM00_20640 [Burkholderia cepacia]